MNEKDTGSDFCCEANSAPEERCGEAIGTRGKMNRSSPEDHISESTMADLWLMVIESYEKRHPEKAFP